MSVYRFSRTIGLLAAGWVWAFSTAMAQAAPTATVTSLAGQLQAGDVVFIHVSPLPFEKVSMATQSWVNHVGVVSRIENGTPIVAESTFPFSRLTPFSRFAARSQEGRIAVMRLRIPPDSVQTDAIANASQKRLGILYDTGFDLHSNGEFCSRFVHEVLLEATGQSVGQVENFSTLLASNPSTSLTFWKIWFFGRIPWQRETITPASLYRSPRLQSIFDGKAT